MKHRHVLCLLVVLLLPLGALAQASANYSLEESTLNNGGDPKDGVVLTSSNYQITLDAIGDSVAGTAMSSGSYESGGGFVPGYPPPGEVVNLLFTDAVTMVWDPEASTGTYTLYRGDLTALPGSYGSAEQQDLPSETAADATTPTSGQCLFYLVTAENRIDEEGTKGTDSSGTVRP